MSWQHVECPNIMIRCRDGDDDNKFSRYVAGGAGEGALTHIYVRVYYTPREEAARAVFCLRRAETLRACDRKYAKLSYVRRRSWWEIAAVPTRGVYYVLCGGFVRVYNGNGISMCNMQITIINHLTSFDTKQRYNNTNSKSLINTKKNTII